MNFGQVLEIYFGWIVKQGWKVEGILEWVVKFLQEVFEVVFGMKVVMLVFDGVSEEEIFGFFDLMFLICDGICLIDLSGKMQLFDGCFGELFLVLIFVGYMYILKLYYLVDDKIYVCFMGLYLMIIQQLFGGKVQFGGQCFGEMEVWVFEVYGVVYVFQEFFMIKFDDIFGCVKVYEVIVKGENIQELGIFELFKVFMKEMQLFCLNVEVFLVDGMLVNFCDIDDEVFCVVEEFGINIFSCFEVVLIDEI